jgi:predicted Zn-dependent peptidase
MYELTQLENGLRVVTVPMPQAYSVSMGLYLGVGSRYETDAEAGASHFIEHLLFKGTERRPSPRDIALAIEGVGGSINASTGREVTSYYVRVAKHDFAMAADVLADMLLNSRFLPTDVEREAQVIVEEINESQDMPDDIVFMEAQKILYPHHPLGRDIAGSRESVRGLSRTTLLDYMVQGYAPANAVVAVAGGVTHGQVVDRVGGLLGAWQGTHTLTTIPYVGKPEARVTVTNRPVEQTHIVLTTHALHRHHPDRFALALLNSVLGEGMSSRLFVEIREERGLAYSIYSYVTALNDTGTFSVYAAVDQEQTETTIQAILAELHRLREEPIGEEELGYAKAYVRGSLLLSLEHSGTNAGWVGNRLITSNTIPTPEEVVAQFERVTSADIQRLARELFRDEALLLSLVGPVNEQRDWQALLRVE